MVIGRKLIVPTLLTFALLLLLALGYFAINAARQLNLEQERTLQSMQQGLHDELARMEDVSLALARQVASNPDVKSAFGSKDFDQLLAITRPGFLNLRGEYKISEHQFTRAPAQLLLDVVEPERASLDLSNMRRTLVTANTQGIEVVGLEMVEYGLCVHGIAPIEGHSPSGAPVYGSVEYGLRLDASTFSDLRARYGGDWQFLLYIPAATAAGVADLMSAELPSGIAAPAELALQSTTLEQPLFAPVDQYRRALAGEPAVGTYQAGEKQYVILTTPLKDYSGQVVGVVDILWDRSGLVAQMVRYLITALAVGLGGLLLAGLLLSRVIGRTLRPVQALTITADAFAHGNLRHPLPVIHPDEPAPDEIELLSRGFYTMGQQLRQLVGNLETMVAERTRGLEQRNNQMQAAAEIARQAAALTRLDDLLAQAAMLIQQRFELYHVGIYLLDPGGEIAYLRAVGGEHVQLLEGDAERTTRNLRVGPTGAGQGLVSAALATGQAIATADIAHDPFYTPDALLPETRSQAAYPLIVADKVIGVLDLHSRNLGAFSLLPGESRPGTSGIQPALQIIADQLATAVNNGRLIETLERTVSELGEARGLQTGENWLAFIRSRSTATGYRYAPEDLQLRSRAAGGLQVIQRGELPTILGPGAGQDSTELNVPIQLRGQTIGVIRLRFDTPASRLQVEAVAEEVGARLALLLESARLLEEAQHRAQREQQINVIATQMRSAVDLEGVLHSTVRELGKALGARRTYIQLGDYAVSSPTLDAIDPANIDASNADREA